MSSVPIPRRPGGRANIRMPDAPPLKTRSNNKPHEIQGPPLVRRNRDQIEADAAIAAAAKAAEEEKQRAALARVAAEEDSNMREDEQRKRGGRASPGDAQPAQAFDDEPERQHEPYDDEPNGTEDEFRASEEEESDEESEAGKKQKKKATRRDAQALRRTQDTTGTPNLDGLGKRKASDGHSAGAASKKAKVVPKKSGLAVKAPPKKAPAAVAAQDDEPMFQPGGPALEDGDEAIEHPSAGVRKGRAKGLPKLDAVRVSQKAMRGGADKWALIHLPANTSDHFSKHVVPLAKEAIGVAEGCPWRNFDVVQVQGLVDRVFGEGVHTVVQKGPWVHLVHYRLTDIRRSFLEPASQAIRNQISTAEERKAEREKTEAPAAGLNADDEEFDLTTKEGVADWVDWLCSDAPDGHSKCFHWEDWSEAEPKDAFATYPILYTFANAWLTFPETIPVEYTPSKKRPYGAFLLAIQAVDYTLARWKTGEYVPSTKDREEKFSGDNWADYTEVTGTNKRRKVRRATKWLKTLQSWTDDEWVDLLDHAASLRLKPRRGSSRASSRASSSAPEEDIEEEEEEEFVLGRA
ncbi:hypothetical protein GGX14DRAFT_572207 [Mycena pura]|uniref:Uncharacterized protein n=1 Tax=Mycena pura TaxID=153505 RepID=A0AAD6YB25_9AGAR|nr:hypothetical protein GGX14DRAFT_572207 [Mycena pura]